MIDLAAIGSNVSPWALALGIYFVWISFFLIMRRIVFNHIEKIAKRIGNKIDGIFTRSAELPLTLLIFSSGLLLVDALTPIGVNYGLSQHFHFIFKIAAVIALILFSDRAMKALLSYYASRVDFIRTSGSLLQGIARGIVIGIGLLILMDSLGIPITPLLASLGVGSLAVALALQPTLENLFSGVQIVIDKPVRIGDFIKLESGEEGFVEKIGWRSTWVKLLPNNVVIIPNKVLVDSKVLNYFYPSRDLAVLVQVGVHYDSDLGHVERVTIETARETLKEVPGGVANFDPFIRYHTFGDFSINFTAILRAKEFVDNYLIKHEFIKRLHKRYAKEGIIIPYPIRAINTTQENSAPASPGKF